MKPNRPSLSELAKSIKTELHVAVSTLISVKGVSIFDRRTIQRELVAIGDEQLCPREDNLLKVIRDLEGVDYVRSIKREQIPPDARSQILSSNIFQHSPNEPRELMHLVAMYALALTQRHDVSLYEVLGHYDNPKQQSSLGDWIRTLNVLDSKDDVFLNTLAAPGISRNTLDKRMRSLEKQGYVKLKHVDTGSRYEAERMTILGADAAEGSVLWDFQQKLRGDPCAAAFLKDFSCAAADTYMGGRWKRRSVRDSLRKLRRRGYIKKKAEHKYDKTKIALTEKGNVLVYDVAKRLVRFHEKSEKDYVLQSGIGFFASGRDIDMPKYHEAVRTALARYQSKQHNARRHRGASAPLVQVEN